MKFEIDRTAKEEMRGEAVTLENTTKKSPCNTMTTVLHGRIIFKEG